MKFNTSKCVHVSFRKHAVTPCPSPFKMDDTEVTTADRRCHLGITLSPNLSFSDHITKTTSKYCSRVFLLCHLTRCLPAPTINLLYKCYVKPLLEYAVPVWLFAMSSTQSCTLDRLQATAARSYLMRKTRQLLTWTISKNVLNHLCEWESLQWRRQILPL